MAGRRAAKASCSLEMIAWTHDLWPKGNSSAYAMERTEPKSTSRKRISHTAEHKTHESRTRSS